MDNFQVYKDIQIRTKGEIYLGVVGPVRTGKSTFIKRFMDLMVLPKIEEENTKRQIQDELPQSGSGKTIMTTEPKFIPKEAAGIMIGDASVKVRLIDCVGYLVKGAVGYEENETERMVKTPWFEESIPFTKAADLGTHKVIHDHATIGIVVTTDCSFGELKREQYLEAEEKTIRELKQIGKPFIVIVNTIHPFNTETKELAQKLEESYGVSTIPVNCEQLKEEDIGNIMKKVLFEFPVSEVQFFISRWVEMLPKEHPVKQELVLHIREMMQKIHEIKDVADGIRTPESQYMDAVSVEKIDMDTGCVKIKIDIGEQYYYQMLSELTGEEIEDEYDLLRKMREMAQLRETYTSVRDAMDEVHRKGYGVVTPGVDEIELEEPSMIKQGNRYGVKIHSKAPSIHMIRANIETELAPIVGSEDQAQDLIRYINESKEKEGGIWSANIFGKSMESMVLESMRSKIGKINEESQEKLQDTMQKIVNDSNGGLVCIII